jgi:sulfite reductase (NADPH) flavoprotein alpha-component
MFTNEIHLTVGLVSYNGDGRIRKGAASSFLGERVKKDDKIRVFVEENENFRLPADSSTDIIMIGPGTGMAPFRAFMQEREITGGKGKNWLFYGDRNFTTDFLYQTDWQTWRKKGLLTHIDLAFSRDQPDKIYVQHRLKSRSKQLFKWIEEGASVYVCGDRLQMAPDVQKTFTEIIGKEIGTSPDDARAYIKELRRQKRYLEDAY